MNEENKETENSENQEDKTSEETSEVKNEESEKDSKTLESLAAQKAHFREKAEKSESKVQELQSQLDELKKAQTKEEEKEVQKSGKFSDDERDFLLEHREVDAETFSVVRRLSKGYEIGLDEAYKNPEVQDFLKFRKEKAEKEAATPPPSTRNTGSQEGKPDFKTKEGRQKWQQEQLSKMNKGGNTSI